MSRVMRHCWCLLGLAVAWPGIAAAQPASGLSGTAPSPPSALMAPATPSVAADPLSPVARPLRQPARPADPGQVRSDAGVRPTPPETPLDVRSRRLDREIRRGICTGC
jgi:hypothetical protein